MNRLGNERGVIFVAALAIMLTFMTFGFTLASIAKLEVETARNSFRILKDFYSAESAVAHGIADMMYGGSGIVAANDLYADNSGGDYFTTVDAATNTITGYSAYLPMTFRQVKAQVTGINRAILVGNTLSLSAPSGTIEGDIRYGMGSAPVVGTHNGNVLSTGGSVQAYMPTPNMTEFQNNAAYTEPGSVVYRSTNLPPSPGGNGIIFVNGDIDIEEDSINVNGTLVATGDVHINSLTFPPTNLKVTPIANYPAIVAAGNITIYGASGASFYGLVYSSSSISVTNSSGISFDGGIAAYQDLTISGNATETIVFDPTMDMPYFDSDISMVPVKVATWVGHGPMP